MTPGEANAAVTDDPTDASTAHTPSADTPTVDVPASRCATSGSTRRSPAAEATPTGDGDPGPVWIVVDASRDQGETQYILRVQP